MVVMVRMPVICHKSNATGWRIIANQRLCPLERVLVSFLLGNESCGIHKLEILPETVKDTKCYELDSRGKPEAAGEVEVLQRWEQHAWGGICCGSGTLWLPLRWQLPFRSAGQPHTEIATPWLLTLWGPFGLVRPFILPAEVSKANQVHQGQVLLRGHCQRLQQSPLQTAEPEIGLPKRVTSRVM